MTLAEKILKELSREKPNLDIIKSLCKKEVLNGCLTKPQKNIISVIKSLAKDTQKRHSQGYVTHWGVYHQNNYLYVTNGHALFKILATSEVLEALKLEQLPENNIHYNSIVNLYENNLDGISVTITYKEINAKQKIQKVTLPKDDKDIINIYGKYLNINYLLDCFKLTGKQDLQIVVGDDFKPVRVFDIQSGFDCLIAPTKKKG